MKNYKIYRDGIELGRVLFCLDDRDAIQAARLKWGHWYRNENGDYGAIRYLAIVEKT
jgi:hypothetical protein